MRRRRRMETGGNENEEERDRWVGGRARQASWMFG